MLDMGFAPDVKRVVQRLPAKRQSLLFSATMPQEIRDIASNLLRDPIDVEVTPVASTAERVDQRVMHVDGANKHRLLVHVLEKHREELVLVFSRTKHGANRLVQKLDRDGIAAAAIHGNKSQGARTRALEDFRNGRTRVLVATDIAARGIDVKGIGLVVNFDLPNEPEAYVHRIGRTARAGAEGLAISFCSPDERDYLRDIQRLIRLNIPVQQDHPFARGGAPLGEPPVRASMGQARGHGGSGRGPGGGAQARHPRRSESGGRTGAGERRSSGQHRAQTLHGQLKARGESRSAEEKSGPAEASPLARTGRFISSLFRGRR